MRRYADNSARSVTVGVCPGQGTGGFEIALLSWLTRIVRQHWHSYTRFRSVDSSFRTIDPHYTPATGRGASLYSAIRPFAENTHASYLDPTKRKGRMPFISPGSVGSHVVDAVARDTSITDQPACCTADGGNGTHRECLAAAAQPYKNTRMNTYDNGKFHAAVLGRPAGLRALPSDRSALVPACTVFTYFYVSTLTGDGAKLTGSRATRHSNCTNQPCTFPPACA
ncbi:Uncharacterized protein DBV15_03175 [Temnothorax longispinosus]|uniref:Uncharacterized protein n=1 Tax=Temnothorax longispinosus TaxID=300112 RepID=A0A4S2KT65_9HYME|nr:Uncharacterized protein DBV15_03175 [Temnothorax longispinosus]